MNKMRKVLTALLTTATIFSMTGAPVQAAEETTAVKGLSFTKVFESENGGVLPDETFEFTMKPAEVEDNLTTASGYPIKSGLDLGEDCDTVNLDFGYGHDASQTGTFSFEDVEWPAEKTPTVYRYVVDEVDGSNLNITYDQTEYIVDVTVDNTGKVVAAASYNNCGNKQPIKFTNTSKTDDLLITKTVTGQMGDLAKSFNFTLLIPETSNTVKLKATYQTFKGIFHRQDGSKSEVSIPVGEEYNFTLANGESLEIKNVPEGMLYTVTEQAYNDYETTIVGTTYQIVNGEKKVVEADVEGSTYSAEAKGTPIVDGGNTVAFTNANTITPTGIALDVAPYLAVLLLAVGGALAVVVTRKRPQR
jgi:pilin isopeptide linkage protein